MLIKTISTLLITTLLMTTGSSITSNKNLMKKTKAVKNEVVEIQKNNNKIIKSSITEFNFGNEKYVSNAGQIMPYKIKGVIGVPEGQGKFPIVLIIHGSHENEDETKRFDTGFKYLVQKLSQNGYIVVSMDVSPAYIWKYGDNDDKDKIVSMSDKYLKSLKKANKGDKSGFKIDLKNKIDFNNLSLIGHSRGGETVLHVAKDQMKKKQNIKSILSVAPTGFDVEKQWSDINTAIIVPEYDGDVQRLDGFYIYDILKKQKRNNFTALTFLKKGNHNYFNSNVLKNDTELLDKNIKIQLSRKEQEDFLANYATDFLNASVKRKIINTMYDSKIPTPNKMYGCEVKTLLQNNNTREIVNIKSTDAFKQLGNVEIKAVQDSYKYDKDTSQGFTSPSMGEDNYSIKNLINIRWKKINDAISITPNIKNFSNNNSIVFDIAQDPSDKLNKKGQTQCFTIELKDRKGNISRVVLDPKTTALDYVDGKLESTEINEEYKAYYWTNQTPLAQVRVPLNKFKNVDLKNIKKISLIFDKINSGAIMINSIKLQ